MPALVQMRSLDYHAIVISSLVTWMAVVAQVVSATGSGYVLCIDREGQVRLVVADAPCVSCCHCDDSNDGHEECSEESCRDESVVEPSSLQACDCAHIRICDPALVAMPSTEKAAAQDGMDCQAVVTPDQLATPDILTASRGHDPPENSRSNTAHLLLISSVFLRC